MKEHILSFFQNQTIIEGQEGKRKIFRRICALFLTVTLLLSAVPQQGSAAYKPTYKSVGSYLSLFYAQATIPEGKASGRAERFFAHIAGIAMNDAEDNDFYEQLAEAVLAEFKDIRIFVAHEKGMPETDLVLVYCFKNSTWLLKDTTKIWDSTYVDGSRVPLERMQSLDLNLNQQEIMDLVVPGNDGSYECEPELVWQIFMYFYIYIEERNKAIDIFQKGTTDYVPPLPETIDEWPLSIPVSVQVPAELQVLEAFFLVDATGNADAVQYEYIENIPESKRIAGTVDQNNLITGTVLVWEPGPHLVQVYIIVKIKDFKETLKYHIQIDTSDIVEECRHEQTEENEIEGSRVYSVVPGNNARHYVVSSEFNQICVTCQKVISSENTTRTFTPETTIFSDIHTPNSEGYCTFCGYKMDDKALYLNYMKQDKESGINPMHDKRVTDLMQARFLDAGFDIQQWKDIFDVLERAPEKYRDLYLLGLFEYEMTGNAKKKRDTDVCNYIGVDIYKLNPKDTKNRLTMLADYKGDFTTVFFHEAGHASQDQPKTVDKEYEYTYIDNYSTFMPTSPFYDAELAANEALYDDVKTTIDGAIEEYVNNPFDVLQKFAESFDENNTGYDMMQHIKKMKELINKSKENISEENRMQLLNELRYEYRQLTGETLPESVSEKTRDNLNEAFVDDKTWINTVTTSYTYSPDSCSLENRGLYILVHTVIVEELKEVVRHNEVMVGDNNADKSNASMVSDIYGGVTNQKLFGNAGHSNDSSYWYDENGDQTYLQISEAWAEFFSAKIRNDTYNIEQNKNFFPTATECLEDLADAMLEYYTQMYQ